jgi:hypothetical protein
VREDGPVLGAASAERRVTRRLHIGFVAPTRVAVDEFWRVGTAAGYRDDGAPGLRRDRGGSCRSSPSGTAPDGNNVEVVNHDR